MRQVVRGVQPVYRQTRGAASFSLTESVAEAEGIGQPATSEQTIWFRDSFHGHAPAKLHPVSIVLVNVDGHCLDEPQRFLLKLLNCGKCDLRSLLNQCL